VYATSAREATNTAIGDGALLGNVRQIHSQGSLEFTDNALDLAVNGTGFFMTSADLDTLVPSYTRSGAFGTNADGYLIDGTGSYLQVFPVDPETGAVQAAGKNSAKSVQVNETFGNAIPTTGVGIAVNTWETRTYFDGQAMTPSAGTDTNIQFNGAGVMTGPPGGMMQFDPELMGNGADSVEIAIDYSPEGTTATTTQQATQFFVPHVEQNGSQIGRLSGLSRTVTWKPNTVTVERFHLAD